MQQSAKKTMFAEARNQPQFEVDTSYINHYLFAADIFTIPLLFTQIAAPDAPCRL